MLKEFLGTNYCSHRYFTDEDGSYILTDFMNRHSARNGGPEFVFDTFYSNFKIFIKINNVSILIVVLLPNTNRILKNMIFVSLKIIKQDMCSLSI